MRFFLQIAFVAALAAATWWVVPRGVEAGRWIAAEDDPVALSKLALDRTLDADRVRREIEAALTAGDVELAQSFVELARERGLPVDPDQVARVEQAATTAEQSKRGLRQFARGFIVGEPDDFASLAGTALGDLFVYGDARDVVREGIRFARGEEGDQLVLGLACIGLAVTAGTYASLGAGTPARVGLSVVKAAQRTGRMSVKFSGALVRAVGEVVDKAALKQAFTRAAVVRPVIALRAAREAVKVEKAGGIVHLVQDVGRVQRTAGTRAALDSLKLADEPKDVARLARLAEAKGGKTRATLKVLGRSAIVLTSSLFTLASWTLWALFMLFWLAAAIKRMAERMTLRHLTRNKLRRLRRLERTLAAAPVPA